MEENLRETLMGGQSFSWREEDDGSFTAVLGGELRRIRRLSDAASNPYLARYFDLDTNYEEIRAELSSRDGILKEAVSLVGPIRILRQDPWTALISFILSQNNNIKRITGLYERLSRAYGSPVGNGRYAFPSKEELSRADEEALRALGVGFRAPFIIDAVKKASIIDEIPLLSDDEAMERLMTIKGIGPKVASCILLYGFHRMEAFPVDVWIRRVLDSLYPGREPSSFSPNAALAQQYLFSWSRLIFKREGEKDMFAERKEEKLRRKIDRIKKREGEMEAYHDRDNAYVSETNELIGDQSKADNLHEYYANVREDREKDRLKAERRIKKAEEKIEELEKSDK